MKWIWTLSKYMVSFLLLVGLVFASGVFSVLLYGRITGKDWAISYRQTVAYAATGDATVEVVPTVPVPTLTPTPIPPQVPKKASVLLDAPAIRQFPELPSGCELTSLTMLLQFAGIQKNKMELVPEMKKDPTPMRKNPDGSIAYWGNPNTGFVGEITGKARGFGIYHAALYDLLAQYVPEAEDWTGSSFDRLEQQLSDGTPVVVWTTLDFQVPAHWVVWDTPLGPIRTTFMEHAVLLVGYDEEHVYINDPNTGKSQVQISKKQFKATWEEMGKQALTYVKDA